MHGMAFKDGGGCRTNSMSEGSFPASSNVSNPGKVGLRFVLGLGNDLLAACQSKHPKTKRALTLEPTCSLLHGSVGLLSWFRMALRGGSDNALRTERTCNRCNACLIPKRLGPCHV